MRYLVGDLGIRQFLDIGTGIPAANNTHEVAQSIVPETRVVYVDNDPMALAHARALLSSGPHGATAYIDADLRDTDKILAEAAQTLDFTRPVAVMLIAVLHLIREEDNPAGIIARLMAAVPPGNTLAISHVPDDMHMAAMSDMSERLNRLLPARHLPQPCPGRELLRRPRTRPAGPGPHSGMAARHAGGGLGGRRDVGRRGGEGVSRIRGTLAAGVSG